MSETYGQAYFEKYEATFAGNEGIHFGIAEAIKRAFPDAITVLDAGCGRGYITQHLASLYPEVTGVDVSEWACTHPIAHGLDIRRMDVCDLVGQAPFWDLVVSWQLLEHLPDEDAAWRAVAGMDGIGRFAAVHSIRVAESGHGEDETHTLMRPRRWWIDLFKGVNAYVEPAWQRLLEEAGGWYGSKELFVLRHG